MDMPVLFASSGKKIVFVKYGTYFCPSTYYQIIVSNITKKSYWLKSGFYTLSERLAIMVFGFGGAMLLFRALPKADFGYWVAFLTIVAVLEVGRIGLLQNALVKYLATSEEEDYAKITTASVWLNLLLTGFMVLCLWFLAPLLCIWLNAEILIPLLKIYCLTTILLIPYFQFNFIQQANLDFKGIFWSSFGKQGLMFCYVVFIFLFTDHISLIDLALFQLVTASFGSIISYSFAKKYLRFNWQLNWDWVKKLFHYGKYVFGTNLSTMLYKSIDKMMLLAIPIAGPVAVALYEAAIKVTNLTDVPTFSMANILFPQSARRMDEGKEAVKMLYEKAVGAILTVMIPCIIGVMVLAEIIISVLAGEEYFQAANLLRLTILYGLFMPFAIQFGTVLDSIGKPKINFFMTLLSMIMNVIFNYIFITQYGVYGAAYGTLLTYSLTFILMQFILHKELKVNAFRAFFYMFEFYGLAYNTGIKYLKKQKKINLNPSPINNGDSPISNISPKDVPFN
jgi:O-antigen/teichoic acid export membrane protein